MLKRMVRAVVVMLVLTSSAQANERLVQHLRRIGKAVDEMAVNISKAESDTDAARQA